MDVLCVCTVFGTQSMMISVSRMYNQPLDDFLNNITESQITASRR